MLPPLPQDCILWCLEVVLSLAGENKNVAQEKKQKNPAILLGFLWYLQESNQGHTDFQSVALPTELRYHALKRLQI